MKNNNGKGLYEIGEISYFPCGCIARVEEIGYTQYIDPECEFCNRPHGKLPNYRYETMANLERYLLAFKHEGG